MAFALECSIVDEGDGVIKVVHTFYGETEKEVEAYKREHIHSCEYFRAALKDGRVIEDLEEIDDCDLPTAEDYEDET